jgi:hypothetical protein
MRARSKSSWRTGALLLTLVVVAACAGSTATWPVPHPSATGPDRQFVPLPSAASARPVISDAPKTTAAAVTVNSITADYVYTTELVTPIAHLYGTFLDDFVVVTIKNGNSQPVKVVVTTEIVDYTDKSTDTVTVAANGTKVIRQNPRLTTAAIDGLNSEHNADFHIVVSYLDNGENRTVLDQTDQTLVTSRRDFPWVIKGMSQQEDFNLLPAMVTPTDPAVEALIRSAGNYDPSHAMTSGYTKAGDSDNSVYQRLSDLWQAETTDYSLTYISTTISFAPGSSQRIRLPAEVLNQASGNCIELVLLYASAVEALGMDPVIVLVPGHAYLAVNVDGQGNTYYFVETTMIGQNTFDEAVTYAGTEWDTAHPHLKAGEKDYGWVDVVSQRSNGVLPIPWR